MKHEDEKTDPENPIAKALEPLLRRLFREEREETQRLLTAQTRELEGMRRIILDHEERISQIEALFPAREQLT